MFLKRIEIRNFRNYGFEKLGLFKGLNVIHGPNGAGKTNFLEAVGLLSHGKSLRLRNSDDLISDGSETTHLEGVFGNNQGSSISVHCSMSREKGKKILVNGKAAEKISDIFRLVPTVQCFENDSNLLQGAPSLRRNFLDCLCTQLHPAYLQFHREFRDILKKRNFLLRQGKLAGAMKRAIDAVFAQKAALVTFLRNSTLLQLSVVLSEQSQNFEGEQSLSVDEKDLVHQQEENQLVELILKKLERSSAEELRFFRTNVGPHRDSFNFIVNESRVRFRSSRGQIKNMVMKIKMAEYHLLHKSLKRIPIVILDDIFAEMDEVRRGNLRSLLRLGSQIFWASTGDLPFEISKNEQFMRIDVLNGQIQQKREVLAAA